METDTPSNRSLISGENARYFVKRGLRLAVILFVIELVAFFITVNIPFFTGEQQSYTESAKQISDQLSNVTPLVQVGEIFANNLKVALIEFIPGFGAFFFGASIYETARITQAIALDHNISAPVIVATLFLFPHSWIELPAYALATAEGLFVLYALGRWVRSREVGPLEEEWKQLILSLVIVVVTLVVAAIFEVTEIQIGIDALTMWAPFGFIAALLILLRRKYSTPVVDTGVRPQDASQAAKTRVVSEVMACRLGSSTGLPRRA